MFRATNIMEILRQKSVSSATILAAIILTDPQAARSLARMVSLATPCRRGYP
jgi:hypothetical protein